MSSDEDIDEYRSGNASVHSKPSPGQTQAARKRRILRACDICRKRKIRCDGEQPPSNKCTSCIESNLECTFLQTSKKRGPPRKAKTQYVENLENRVEKMEKLLSTLALDSEQHPELAEFRAESGGASSAPSSFTLPEHAIKSPLFDPLPESIDSDSGEDSYEGSVNIQKHMLTVPNHGRFFGKSSGVMLIQTAIDMKKQFTGTESTGANAGGPYRRHFFQARRVEFWNPLPWEVLNLPKQRNDLVFPEPDLFPQLVDLYFKHFNFIYALLHRPTFNRQIAEGLHFTDVEFGTTVLLVCAVGSRYSTDRRVLLPETDGSPVGHLSAGWKYFEQVRITERAKLHAPNLYDLQAYCLWTFFMQGGSAPQACWIKIGFGIRIAQDVGRHRRMTYSSTPNATDELWKRAFWTLVALDRSVSGGLGRSCAIHDEDFDLDLPLEVDDEYWEHSDPEKAFVQPPGKPSVPSFLVTYLKLQEILAFLLRTIYSTNKSKSLLGSGRHIRDQQVVAELDSAMNKWIDTVPEHLRWDPNREDPIFFCQSAFLHVVFYHLQILIHRPFIPTPRKPSSVTFPSLAICTNAARTCARIIDAHRRRGELPVPVVHWQMATFSTGIVLLINMWGGKRSGTITDVDKELADVGKCMDSLKTGERRWHSAGRLWDVLYELSSVGVMPLSDVHPFDVSDGCLFPPPPPKETDDNSHQVLYRQTASASPPVPGVHTTPPPLYTLPLYSNDLGKLPLYGADAFWNNATPRPNSDASVWYSAQDTKTAELPGSLNHLTGSDGTVPPVFPSDASTFYEQRNSDLPPSLPSDINSGNTGYTDYIQDSQPQTGFMYGQPQPGLHPQEQPMEGAMDVDTMAMWNNAPSGFNLHDWELFMSELTQGPQQVPNV